MGATVKPCFSIQHFTEELAANGNALTSVGGKGAAFSLGATAP